MHLKISSKDITLEDVNEPKIPLDIIPDSNVYYRYLGKLWEKEFKKASRDTDLKKLYQISKKQFPLLSEEEIFGLAFKVGYGAGRLRTANDSGDSDDD